MRQIKNLMRAKKPMWRCGECKCVTLQAWRCADELCNCGDATIGDMRGYALNWFATSPLLDNVTDSDAVMADAQTIIDGAGEELRPFYNAAKEGKTFEAYVTENGLTVDESGACDDELANTDAAFILYVSAMGTIDCKYLGLSSGDIINAQEIADYLDYINAN